MKEKSFYITTTLPYVNADPHIGFAMEIIHADIIARWKKSQGYEVFFNTGTDEHGQKVFNTAQKEGKDTQKYTDELAEKFKNLQSLLGLSEDLHFIRTTEEKHKKAAQEMWKRCNDAGFIEKKQYQIKYCVGCELEKTDSELVDGKCPIHPSKDIEIIEEENYFFKFSVFADKLSDLYKKPEFVIPDYRLNEIRALIDRGLEDFSISRLKEKMPWGVAVPGDPDHVMYVWFDALTSYISTLGWPDDMDMFNKFWNGETNVQFAGKDQVRQQTAMWQAMLLAADLPPTSQIIIHGFLDLAGQKMSKSLGNVITPKDMVDRYGKESTRTMLAGVNQFEDTNVSIGVEGEGFDLAYDINLKDGLGNLVARIMKLAEDYKVQALLRDNPLPVDFVDHLNSFRVKDALEIIWHKIRKIDQKITKEEPFKVIKSDLDIGKAIIQELEIELYDVARMLTSFMPDTANTIIESLRAVKKPENLFPRLNA